MNMNMVRLLILTVSFYSLIRASVAQEQIALSLQVAIVKQVFQYDRKLSRQDTIRVAVVHSNVADKSVERLVSEFHLQSDERVILSSAVPESALKDFIKNYDVLYLLQVGNPQSVHDLSCQAGTLTITNTEAAVKLGHATAAVVFKDGKPMLYINRNSERAEGREFYGEILTLAKLYD